jgi:hypothetical protein
MSTPDATPPSNRNRWLLPVILALIIIAVIAGAFFATHPHVFGGSATSTPTPTVTPTVTPTPPATGTPAPGPTGTPRPGPTGTPQPGPTATPGGIKTGAITHPAAQILDIQRKANQKNPAYLFYLDPFQVVQNNLPAYGFGTGFKAVSPPPQPTPTPYTNPQGKPEEQITVQYQSKRYLIILDQPVQKGPSGIWVITTIKLVS